MIESDLMIHWDHNKDLLISIIKKKIKKPGEVNDILQEIFLKYWENNHEIKDKNKVRQWLSSVCRFTIADYFRIMKKVIESEDESKYYGLQSLINKDITSDESKKLLPIIYGLPEKYKNILLLSDIHGLPHKIISKQLNLSHTCVRTRVMRARKLLAEKMHECCSFTHDKYGNIISCFNKKAYKAIVEEFKNCNQNLSLFHLIPDNK